ncbi:DUF3761 domain-containing protein [Xenorhabdus poinarii]|uniref:DUF3761 domain-containing protein n=1 Tax=Xenorhabdus poinarii TaxID=40577 RepID=UPI0005F9CDDF|nr:DUF3761 domain-containing protein [Xenorhabdus poinarii]
MKNLKLSVAALLVLFSSTALAAPAVSTSTETAPKTVTSVKNNVKTTKHNANTLDKKVSKKAQKHQASKRKIKKNTVKKNTAKKGANTALCKDGSHSKSQSRKGACARHGGVAKWL